jgi:hypothetical protein
VAGVMLLVPIAVIAVIALIFGLAAPAWRRHRSERHEVEQMFNSEGDDRVWWEERL